MQGNDKERVAIDNVITAFVLELLQKQAEQGRGALRENPTRSLQWWLPQEITMWKSGLWLETCYAACALMGARCKQQTLRHCIQEIDQWPAVHCNHCHAKSEWDPFMANGVKHYPSKEEGSTQLAYLL